MASAFERLSPALQYQIVNALGWRGLRPVQEASTEAILDGANCVVLAPTAGGKTEAALFPLLTLMDSEDRPPVSTLYIAPIRALLNNQEARLERLTGLLGRRSFKWHGDVGDSARKRFIRDPADVLSITPESLEAMLMSSRVPARTLLAHVQAVVIDEVHAFAADDRGAHLMAVLERVCRLSGRDIQRIGLSATVGDPEAILAWMSGGSKRRRQVVNPGGGKKTPDLKLDFVGDLGNAALMIDRLYSGTKRLVFVDSRRRVEELGHHLAGRNVDVYVTHSSLAASERHAAERAFEEGKNCVIVATSALELGIDVGELDHVFQVDAPSSVASFLQRMGRTGRREGTTPNCTFLATKEEAVLRSAAILHLHASGFVESTRPSRRAGHVLAHQLLVLAMQERGVAEGEWWSWVAGCGAFRGLDARDRSELVSHMCEESILVSGDHRLMLGPRGEKLYGHRNFMELYAVFSAPPVLKVMFGHQEVGSIDAWFLQLDEKPNRCAFVLAGRPWKVVRIDWKSGTALVEPAEDGAYPSWFGQPVLLSRELCEAMRALLSGDASEPTWSRRASKVMAEMREDYAFLQDDTTALQSSGDRVKWWTFAGGRANALLAACLRERLGDKVIANNLAVTLAGDAAKSDAAIREAIALLRGEGALTDEVAHHHAPEAGKARLSKFQPCLPPRLERELVTRNLLDVEGARFAVGLDLVVAEPEEAPGGEDAVVFGLEAATEDG
jgi:ATP-dependent Lhr-like helicase